MDAYFNKSDPTFVAYRQYLEDFSSDEQAYILYQAPNREHGPFNYEVMQKVAQITTQLEQEVPFANKVTSLSNVEFMWAQGDDLMVDELLVNFPDSQEALLQVRDRLIKKPPYLDYLIDESLQYGAILVEMTRTSTDPLEQIIYDPAKGSDINNLYPQVSDHAIRKILARPEYSDIEFYISGDTAMNSAYNEIIGKEAGAGLVITLVLVMLVSFILFQVTLTGLIGPVTVVVLSLISTLGFIGFLDWNLGLMFTLVPALICAVGVAQSVHILLEFQRTLDDSANRRSAAVAAIAKVGAPCMMAAVTTAAGFAVMTVSPLKSLSQLGVYASVGVLLTFIISMSLLVTFLGSSNRPKNSIRANNKRMRIHPLVNQIIQWCTYVCLNHRKTILIVSSIIVVIALVGTTRLNIGFNFLTDLKPHMEYRKHTTLVEDVMGGLLNVSYAIDSGQENGLKNPDLLIALDQFQTYAASRPLIKKTFSITDVVKDLNKSLNADQDSFYTIPKSAEAIAQYLLLYELSGGEEKDKLVTFNYQRGVVELRVEITDSHKIELLLEDLDHYLEQNPIPGAKVSRTGIGLLWVKMGTYVSQTQIYSYALIFLMLAIFMCISFGSIKVGLLSMLPNLAPIVLVLGAMSWLGITLDYSKLLLATVAIGIAVDDTIHLVTRFRSRFLESRSYERALTSSMEDVGPALIITSTILIISFLSFLLSSTTVLANFGILLGSTIFIALVTDLLTLPALFLWLKPFGPEEPVSPTQG